MNKNQVTTPKAADQTVEVLYQKMGDRWFAFSLINDEVFVGSISDEEIAGKEAKMYAVSGNT